MAEWSNAIRPGLPPDEYENELWQITPDYAVFVEMATVGWILADSSRGNLSDGYFWTTDAYFDTIYNTKDEAKRAWEEILGS